MYTKYLVDSFSSYISSLEERGHSIIEPSFSAEYALGNYLTYSGKVDDLNLPWMTQEGEFIINGNRKVILSSLVRLPGIYKISANTVKIFPLKGTFITFTLHESNKIEVTLGKSLNIPFTTFYLALSEYFNGSLKNDFPLHEDIINYNLRYTDNTDPVITLYRLLKPHHPAWTIYARVILKRMFFTQERFSFTQQGRSRINSKYNLEIKHLSLDKADIVTAINLLLDPSIKVDDVDHLDNRLLLLPGDKLSSIPLHQHSIDRYFNSSSDCQLLDITNALSILSHKRRILLPSYLSATSRDVHESHFNCLCPIETPEGENIGLILSPTVDALVGNSIEAGTLPISLSASHIPFVNHNDANRALMACSMLKQALPLTCKETPRIKTGYEVMSNGVNLRVAYISYYGHNFEDGIVVSQSAALKLASIKTTKLLIPIHNTPYGREEITADIPNLPPNNLHSSGYIFIGSHVKKGDILLGKIAPRKPKQEEEEHKRLLASIFGRKNIYFKNTSYLSPIDGIVTSIKAFRRKQPAITKESITATLRKEVDKKVIEELSLLLRGEKLPVDITAHNQLLIPAFTPITQSYITLLLEYKDDFTSTSSIINSRLHTIFAKYQEDYFKANNPIYSPPPSYITQVEITIVSHQPLQVGDKLAGRHGNKGIVTRILPDMEMPFDKHGKGMEILLNPLGVPSRMNIGQLLECYYGKYYQDLTVPPFTEPPIRTAPSKELLTDSRTGQLFPTTITTGIAYFYKLDHLVSDKIHARSIGPYSSITQQPTKGRSSKGGQRIGEMEAWALEAYGAAYTLQEMFTIKSDDVHNRHLANDILQSRDLCLNHLSLAPNSTKDLTTLLGGLALGLSTKCSSSEDMPT